MHRPYITLNYRINNEFSVGHILTASSFIYFFYLLIQHTPPSYTYLNIHIDDPIDRYNYIRPGAFENFDNDDEITIRDFDGLNRNIGNGPLLRTLNLADSLNAKRLFLEHKTTPNQQQQQQQQGMLGGGGMGPHPLKRALDSIGGANLLKRAVDRLGGGHLLKRR